MVLIQFYSINLFDEQAGDDWDVRRATLYRVSRNQQNANLLPMSVWIGRHHLKHNLINISFNTRAAHQMKKKNEKKKTIENAASTNSQKRTQKKNVNVQRQIITPRLKFLHSNE